jgi:hypothetical protein
MASGASRRKVGPRFIGTRIGPRRETELRRQPVERRKLRGEQPVAVGSFVGPNVAEPGRIWLVPLSAWCARFATFAGTRLPATMAGRCFTREKSQGRDQAQAGWHPANSSQCSAPRWARPDPSSPEKRARKSSARTWTRSDRSRSVRMGSGFRATRLGRSSTRKGHGPGCVPFHTANDRKLRESADVGRCAETRGCSSSGSQATAHRGRGSIAWSKIPLGGTSGERKVENAGFG